MGDLLALGNVVLGEVRGTVAGTVTPRGGAGVNFTLGQVARHVAAPSGADQSHDECELVIPITPTAGIASAPARDSALTFTGTVPTGMSAGPWQVHTVSQQAPGGVTIAYRLSLIRTYLYGVLQEWAPGTTGG